MRFVHLLNFVVKGSSLFLSKGQHTRCTKEACSFRDGYSTLQDAGIVILGVSFDSPESHRKFKDKQKLPSLFY